MDATSLFGHVYQGTPLGLDGGVSDVWRVVNFGVAFALVGWWSAMLLSRAWNGGRGGHRVPPYTAWGQLALLIFTVHDLVIQAERWGAPAVVEGAPSFSLALMFAFANLVSFQRHAGRRHGCRSDS